MARLENTDTEIVVRPIKALRRAWGVDNQVWIVPHERTSELIALLADLGCSVNLTQAE